MAPKRTKHEAVQELASAVKHMLIDTGYGLGGADQSALASSLLYLEKNDYQLTLDQIANIRVALLAAYNIGIEHARDCPTHPGEIHD